MFLLTIASIQVLPRKVSSFQPCRRVLAAHRGERISPPQKTHPYSDPSPALYSSSTSPEVPVSKTTKPASSFPTVLLRRTSQSKSFRNGNQLVFSKAIDRIYTAIPSETAAGSKSNKKSNSDLSLGDLVHVAVVADNASSSPPVGIGWGVYNPHSLYQIRILVHKFLQPNLYQSILKSSGGSEIDDSDTERVIRLILHHHIQSALSLRSRALHLPDPGRTDTYRLLNGEGDHVSGLAVDIIGLHTAVVVSSAGWCERYRDIVERTLFETVVPKLENVVWKTTPSRLQQDGYETYLQERRQLQQPSDLNQAVSSAKSEGDQDDTLVLSTENGIVYQTYPGLHGQKTGVYCDQRDNRRLLQQYCKGKTVLDLCCYTGGFSLNAAVAGGATRCVGVDSSGPAVAMAQSNAKRNGVDHVCSFVQADIATYLRGSSEGRPQFDVVVLDPPKLAPNTKLLDKAARKYRGLNRDAIHAVNDETGGILLTCTCSAAMTQEDGGRYFLRMVQGAALAAGKHVTLLSVHGAAACHTASPVAFPAGAYLTAAVFYIHPKSGGSKGESTRTTSEA